MSSSICSELCAKKPFDGLYFEIIKDSIDKLLETIGIVPDDIGNITARENCIMEGTTYDVGFRIGLSDGQVIVTSSSNDKDIEFLIKGYHNNVSFRVSLRYVHYDNNRIKLAHYNISLEKDSLGYRIKQRVQKEKEAEITTSFYDSDRDRQVRKGRYHLVIDDMEIVFNEISEFIENPLSKHEKLNGEAGTKTQ